MRIHYVGNQQALDVVTKMADYFQGRLAALPAAYSVYWPLQTTR